MDKLLNKAITINGKEEKLQGGKPVVKIKDEQGLTYTVYKTKQDGSTSVAWTQLADLSLGDTVQIGYAEQQGEYQGSPVTYRSIRSFNKDIGQGMLNVSNQQKKTPQGANNASQSTQDDQYWDKKAYKQCLWNFWLEKVCPQKGDTRFEQTDMDMIWNVFKEIEEDADKRFSPVRQAVEKANPNFFKEELPTIQQDEEINVDDIPF